MPSPQSQQGMPGNQGGGGPRFAGPMSNPDNPMGGNSSDSNMPLNPSGPPGSKSGGPGQGGPPFDPISSLAQMSQQLQASSTGGTLTYSILEILDIVYQNHTSYLAFHNI